MTEDALLYFIAACILFIIVPPVTMLVWAVHSKRVSDWDVSQRGQRVWVFLVFSILLIVDYIVIKVFGNFALETLFISFIVWFIGFFVITFFWKISGHVAGLTLVLGLFWVWYGARVAPFFIFVPLLAWARVVTKNHTLAQVTGGFFYSLALLLFIQ